MLAPQTVALVHRRLRSWPASPARPAPSPATSLSFTLQGFTAGSYVVRLRVDGQDSIPVVAGQTSFDPNQRLVLS